MTAFWTFLSGLGRGIAVIIVIVLNPEKIEKWVGAWSRLFDGVYNGAHKKYVKHDLQGRVNLFTKNLRKIAPDLHETKLRLEWIDEN